MSRVLAVLGPTASGKSEVAMHLAEAIGAIIISVDSMQVYRGMDIGTAKPTAPDRARVRHVGIDLVEPEEEFSVADFQRVARSALASTEQPVVICGGSGMHFRAIVDPMTFRPHDAKLKDAIDALTAGQARIELLEVDPTAALHLDIDNPRRVARALEIFRLTGETPTARAATPEHAALRSYRPSIEFRAVGFDPGEELRARVEQRLRHMVEAGLLQEVTELGPRLGRTARQAVGYKELLPVVDGRMAVSDGVADAVRATMALAKRQRTYFRRDPRLTWLPWSPDPAERIEQATTHLVEPT